MPSKSKLAGIEDFFSSEVQLAELEGQLQSAQEKIAEQADLISQLQRLANVAPVAVNATDIDVPIEQIVRDPHQVRRYFDPEKLAALTQSIQAVGIRERLWVKSLDDGQYQLIAGERRYRAAVAAGLAVVPVTVLDIDTDMALTLSLVENLQREDLNPVEETEGLLHLLSLRLEMPVSEVVSLLYKMRNQEEGRLGENVFPWEQAQVVETVFATVGTMNWRSFISARLPLRNLPEDVLDALRQGQIEYTKARAIARVKEEGDRQALLADAIADNLSLSEIRDRIKVLKPAPAPSLRTRFKEISSQMLKLPKDEWDDSKKAKKLAKLLEQLETFISTDAN